MTTCFIASLFVGWIALIVFFRYNRIWLLFYLTGAVGAAYWLVFATRYLIPLEPLLAHSIAWAVDAISKGIDVPTRIFKNAPGVLLVLVIAQEVGWTVLNIGVESSGLLEMSVLTSLISFYPGWSKNRKLGSILGGLLATWMANVLRMLMIVIMLHNLGKEALVLSHTYAGKAFFFILTIGIYWYIITLPTVRNLASFSKLGLASGR